MRGDILLINNESSFRFSVQLALKRRGYRVCEAHDGGDALRWIAGRADRSSPFELVLLDMDLPTLSGLTVLRRLHQRGVTVPVLVVSGGLTAKLYTELLSLGSREIYFKPVGERVLLDKIDEIVHGAVPTGPLPTPPTDGSD